MSVLNLKWITAPPIFKLQPNDIPQRMTAFRASMDEWGGLVPVPDEPKDDDFDQRDWKQIKRTQQERYNDRIDATNHIASTDFGGANVYEYRVDGRPIGLMQLNKDGYADKLDIALLVAHPGASLAGAILVEFAAQKSDKWNMKGKLALMAADDEAMKFYEELGFEHDGIMNLDPNKSDKWSRGAKNQWVLTKYSKFTQWMS